MTEVLPADASGVARAAALLRSGRPVAIPTETVYGLAAVATDPEAVAAVFTAKQRPADDPLIVHVSPALLGTDPLQGLVARGLVAPMAGPATATARALLTRWPGPLTVVLPRGPAVPPAVTSDLPAVALRMPDHAVAQAVIDAADAPLVAPSANRFGRVSPTSAEAVVAELDGRIPAVVDGGPCAVGVESTVVRVEADGGLTLLRPGAVDRKALQVLTGREPSRPPTRGTHGSPGRMPSHYAPTTPVVLVDASPSAWSDARWTDVVSRAGERGLGWLGWGDETVAQHALETRLTAPVSAESLSRTGDAAEAAQALYAALRRLDAHGHALLVVQRPPEGPGLSEALRDRLRRAAHGTEPLQA